MIKTNKTLTLLFALTLVVAGCKPDAIKGYERVNSGDVKSVAGTWTGVSVLQRDNDAERKNFPYKSMDITSALEFNKVKLTLQENNGQPGNFTIDY
ncbi:MAG TPA: hypothetical protein VD996_16635, partial [Chitinophagaceae bacterium]|nr:hypothetical protein [Chitinophagaceae bacterium]